MSNGDPKEYINLVEKNYFYRTRIEWIGVGPRYYYNKTTFYSKVAIDVKASIISKRVVKLNFFFALINMSFPDIVAPQLFLTNKELVHFFFCAMHHI